MSLYLDASVLVALFTLDAWTARARAWLAGQEAVLVVSDFAGAELVSAIARKVRMQAVTPVEAALAFAHFDQWTARHAERVETTAADIATASAWLRALDPALRTPDAINLAIAQRLALTIVTFDAGMLRAAQALGLAVDDP